MCICKVNTAVYRKYLIQNPRKGVYLRQYLTQQRQRSNMTLYMVSVVYTEYPLHTFNRNCDIIYARKLYDRQMDRSKPICAFSHFGNIRRYVSRSACETPLMRYWFGDSITTSCRNFHFWFLWNPEKNRDYIFNLQILLFCSMYQVLK